jgi:hypothetical protein
MTTTNQLNEWMVRHDPTYLGAFPLDKIPRVPPGRYSYCFIINTQTHNLAGQHWMAVRCLASEAWVFDPLSFPPIPELCNHLLSHCHIIQLHFCKTSVQPLSSNTCGQHAVYFLLKGEGAPSEQMLKSVISKL